MVLVVGASRVSLGVHWFTDTPASLVFGSLVLALVDIGWSNRRCRRRLLHRQRRRELTVVTVTIAAAGAPQTLGTVSAT